MCRDRILRPSDDSSFTYTFINIERISIKGLTSWFFCAILKISSRLSAAAVRTFSVSLKLPCFARLRDKGVVADILVFFLRCLSPHHPFRSRPCWKGMLFLFGFRFVFRMDIIENTAIFSKKEKFFSSLLQFHFFYAIIPSLWSDEQKKLHTRGISAAGSASHWQCGGRGFESHMLHQSPKGVSLWGLFFTSSLFTTNAFGALEVICNSEKWKRVSQGFALPF